VNDRLLTARELAEQLGVSTETILRWTRAGALPGFRLPGGQIRYRPSDVERWLADRATAAAVPVLQDDGGTGRQEGGLLT
jgi:excisionase family DNA binding protein